MQIVSPKFLKLALRIHAVYFFAWAPIFEFLPPPVLNFFGLSLPEGAVGLVAAGVASGGLITAGVLFLLASFQDRIPSFVLVVALVQTAFNLWHDAVWLWNQYHFWLTLLDAVVIASLFVAYLIAWRKARRAPEA